MNILMNSQKMPKKCVLPIQRSRKRGARGGSRPPLFEKGGIAPHFFVSNRMYTVLYMPESPSSVCCMCVYCFTGKTLFSRCLPPLCESPLPLCNLPVKYHENQNLMFYPLNLCAISDIPSWLSDVRIIHAWLAMNVLCYAQSLDLDHPRILLCKARISVMCNASEDFVVRSSDYCDFPRSCNAVQNRI